MRRWRARYFSTLGEIMDRGWLVLRGNRDLLQQAYAVSLVAKRREGISMKQYRFKKDYDYSPRPKAGLLGFIPRDCSPNPKMFRESGGARGGCNPLN